ncbi:MAG: WD40 repeat domain-containing protein [Pseudonocardiaceae bacterium]
MIWRRGDVILTGVGPSGMRFSPDGRRLFVNVVPSLTAWDVRTGRQLYSIETGYHGTLALSADGRIGVTCDPFGNLRVWEAETGQVVHTLPDRADVFEVSADGRYAMTGGDDRTLRVWDLRTGRCVHTLEGHPTFITMVMFSADGHQVVSADATPAIRLWELDWDYDFAP